MLLSSSGSQSWIGNSNSLDSVAWGATASNICSETVGLGPDFGPRNMASSQVSCLCP